MRACYGTRLAIAVLTLALSVAASEPAPEATSRSPGRRGALVVVDDSERSRLERSGLPVIWKGSSFFLAVWDDDDLRAAHRASIRLEVLAPDFGGARPLYLFEVRDDVEPPAAWGDRVLWRDGRKWVLEMDAAEAARWTGAGHAAVRIPDEPRGWEPRAPSVAYDCSYDPLVDELIHQTDQAKWLDWIEKLSGEESVTVSGTEYIVETRYSSPMFSGAPTAKAYDFALQQAQSWHYAPDRLEEHGYDAGGGQTWKNLVLTLPGESFPDDIVLITGHLDSINLGDLMHAPGANDNGTGNATLFEAARLLRQYRFRRTLKIVWFTGEEDGLLGSEAYVDDHPTDGFLGVVNLDMFGWDGDGDRCFEIHAGTLSQSQDVGNCFDDSLTTYGMGLARDYLTWGATDRSDHASFWQVNVGAIEIAENFFSDGLPDGCIGQDANPGYHTTDDTVASNLTPSFGFDIARAGLATIAAMALPIGACFDDAPVLSATPGVSAVDLGWTAVDGAASYRLYRSTQGCEGQWFEVAQTAGTSWRDDGADEATTYYYHVEAVDADGFCVSAASNCAAAVPTVYHATSVSADGIDVCAGGGEGSEDGVIDPGESVLLPVTLQNDGTSRLNEVTGMLSTSTGGVTIIDPSAAWPDLPRGAALPSRPNHFGFQVADSVPCGTTLYAAIDLDYTEGSNHTGLPLTIGNAYEVVLLSEDFAAGIPTDWMVVDGGSGGGAASTWTTSNPGGRSIEAPFDDSFAIVDSDEAGSNATQDEALITPSFDASECTQVVVEFSSQFRWYSGSQDEWADLDLSTDGGTFWWNKLRLQGGSDGYPAPVTKSVDITSTLGGSLADARVRFHYHQADYEWWWAIDNVVVRCTMMECTPCAETALPPGEPGLSAPLTLRRDAGNLVFTWGAPEAGCQAGDYAVYKGDLTTLSSQVYSHDWVLSCATGSTSLTIPETHPSLGAADYYLVVADNGIQEGSYGRDSDGSERPASPSACHAAQNFLSCVP
jgi:leucyl aminopeptidase